MNLQLQDFCSKSIVKGVLHALSEHQTKTVLPGFVKQKVAVLGFDYLFESIWKMKTYFLS